MAENQVQKSRRARNLTAGGIALRFFAALVLILATYNPSRISIYHWVRGSMGEGTLGPEHFVVVVLLLIGWTIYVVASYRSLGRLGLVLVTLFFAALIWLLIDLGWLKADSQTSVTWIILIARPRC
ncbi:MAG: DUF6524 family protein [Woeseiaceae bacterium]|nr:DUF6524 family protein [Woeseiaceae bacterium]